MQKAAFHHEAAILPPVSAAWALCTGCSGRQSPDVWGTRAVSQRKGAARFHGSWSCEYQMLQKRAEAAGEQCAADLCRINTACWASYSDGQSQKHSD